MNNHNEPVQSITFVVEDGRTICKVKGNKIKVWNVKWYVEDESLILCGIMPSVIDFIKYKLGFHEQP